MNERIHDLLAGAQPVSGHLAAVHAVRALGARRPALRARVLRQARTPRDRRAGDEAGGQHARWVGDISNACSTLYYITKYYIT